jgi:hypothetical protein
MKNSKKLFLVITLFAAAYSADAQLYVKVKPDKPEKAKIKVEKNGPGQAYIEEDWEAKGTNYEWNGNRWVQVPKFGASWAPGYWVEKKKGWVWVPGHWQDKK